MRATLLAHQTAMASRGLRTLALASRRFVGVVKGDPQFDHPPEHNMTLFAIVGVKVRGGDGGGMMGIVCMMCMMCMCLFV